MAIALRIGLTLVAVELLAIPGLRFFGAILLVWIAVKLAREVKESTATAISTRRDRFGGPCERSPWPTSS